MPFSSLLDTDLIAVTRDGSADVCTGATLKAYLPAPAALAAPPAPSAYSASEPSVSGAGAVAGATVEVFDGSTSLGTTTASGSGAWKLMLSTALSTAAHSLTARQFAPSLKSGALQVAAQTLSAPTPIAPDAIASTAVGEYFVVDAAHVFSDQEGNTPASSGRLVSYVKPQGTGRPEFMTSGSRQPTFTYHPQVGAVLDFRGAQNLFRFYKGEVGTVLYVFAPDQGGKRTRPTNSCLAALPAQDGEGYSLQQVNVQGFPGEDHMAFRRSRTDGTTQITRISLQVGAFDVLLYRTDGSAAEFNRSGVKATASVNTGTGSAKALDGTKNHTLGCNSGADGSTFDFWNGLFKAAISFPGRVSDAELPGLLQWAVNLAKQQQTYTGFIGAHFNGDSTTNENAASHSLCLTVHNADASKFQVRPASKPIWISGDPYQHAADFGLAAYDGKLFLTLDGAKVPLYTSTDGLNWTQIQSIDCSPQAGGLTASFVRNADNGIYTDPDGKAYLYFDAPPAGGSGGDTISYVPSEDATWSTGGGWGQAVTPAGFAGVANPNQIDPSVMKVGSLFYMIYADYSVGNKNGTIQYATAPAVTGPWALATTTDPFGLGGGFEAPQIISLGGNNFLLRVDADGAGMYNAYSTNGILGPYSTPVPEDGPNLLEHGELVPMSLVPNFPAPALQSTSAPLSTLVYRGRGLLQSNDMGEQAAVGAGWNADNFVGGGGSITVGQHCQVLDPAGNPTASHFTFNLPGDSYASLMCNTVAPVGGDNLNLGARHRYKVWAKGDNGGEKLALYVSEADGTNYTTAQVFTLTEQWAEYHIDHVFPGTVNSAAATMYAGGTGATQVGMSLCWPTVQ